MSGMDTERDTQRPAGAASSGSPSGAPEPHVPEPHAPEPHVSARQVLARFASYYRPYTFLFVLDLVCATVLAAVDLAFPQFLNFFTKDFFLNPPEAILGSLGWIALLFVALYAVRTGCQYFITSWGTSWGRAWRPTCAATCSASTSA